MKRRSLIILLIIETAILVLIFLLAIFFFHSEGALKEVYRQSSKDGRHNLVIYEVGKPDWPFGSAHYKVYGPATFDVDVADDGGDGFFSVDWKEHSVVISFDGSEQGPSVYELPFE